MVAAERLGCPHVSVVVLAAGGMIERAGVDAPLAVLRRRLGVGAAVGRPTRYLSPVMPSFRDPAFPLPADTLLARPQVLAEPVAADEPAAGRVRAWLAGRPALPTIYFTLGTIFHQESGDLFRRVLAGLGTMPANVLVTVGREIDPAELSRPPENALVERFVPQQAVLGRCDLVVSHGGSGTVIAALASGVPVVLLPLGADQPANAQRCEALGVGRMLDPVTSSAEQVAAAVGAILGAPSYRRAALRLRAEALALPGPAELADQLAALPRRAA